MRSPHAPKPDEATSATQAGYGQDAVSTIFRACAAAAGIALALPVIAKESAHTDAALRAEIAELRARLESLEARLAAPAPTAAIAPATVPQTRVDLSQRGLAVRREDLGLELSLRGGLHLDHRELLEGEAAAADGSFTFRRIRPTLEGKFGGIAGFRITPELAGDSVSLLDAWIDVNLHPAFGLRAGRMKGPVSLERLQSFTALPMIERGFASELAPNRVLGVQAMGSLSGGRAQYALGVFNGGPDGRNDGSVDGDENLELQGRVFVEPWRGGTGVLAGLGFGLAGTIGDKDGAGNAFLPRYRSPSQDVLFGYRPTVAADGEHARWSPQLYWYHERLGLLAEHIVSRQVLRLANAAVGPKALSHKAWSVTGSWSLTGEAVSYRGLGTPSEPFVMGTPGWGALELTARLGELDIDDAAFPFYANPDTAASRARSWGVGLNWYLNPHLKVQVDHQRTRFDGGAAGGADRADERTLYSRLQLGF